MTKEQAKEVIIGALEAANGCKSIELIARKEMWPLLEAGHDPVRLIEELIKDNEIVEVQYCLPSMNYRIKSFLLPKGTAILGE